MPAEKNGAFQLAISSNGVYEALVGSLLHIELSISIMRDQIEVGPGVEKHTSWCRRWTLVALDPSAIILQMYEHEDNERVELWPSPIHHHDFADAV